MQKTGETDIYVDSAAVTNHEQLGWHRAKIEISADGQSLIIPHGTYANFESGALKLNSVQMVSSASELNTLNLGEDTMQIVHYSITPGVVSATGVHAANNLGAAGADVTTGITNPDVPRTVTVKGNVPGITGNVVIIGTNILGAAITDTIPLNGASEVEGVKAFKTVTKLVLPARSHTPVAQVETATVAGTIIGSGNAVVVITAAGMTGSPKTIQAQVTALDTASDVAGKIRTALGLDADVIAMFSVGGATNKVILTRLAAAANDATLNISINNGTCAGLISAPTSENTTAGVATDTVSVGIAKKFGIPHIVNHATLLQEKVFDGSDDNGALAVDADEIEKNLFALDGTPNGAKALDLYYLV